jgi:hypothetical protein
MNSREHLHHVHHRQPRARSAREPAQVHQARHVGRDDRFGAGARPVADPVAPHLGRDLRLGDGERAAEAAALVGARRLGEREAAHGGEQRADLVERRPADLARAREAEAAQPVAADVHAHAPRQLGAQRRDPLDADLVVQERAQLRGALGHARAGRA